MESIEICAGAGGQAIGLEQAGFGHTALIEIDYSACNTLRVNRPSWNVIEGDVKSFNAAKYKGIDLLAGGVPCPPFSVAGKQLGHEDERNLFPEVIRLTSECLPKAIMIENVKGLLDPKFEWYRNYITSEIQKLGYVCHWQLLNACDFNVPQLRPRTIMVALKEEYNRYFKWPKPNVKCAPTVGEALLEEMSSNGWQGAEEWSRKANKIAPTIVGGSKKHGGADLGPTRSKIAWEKLGVDGSGLNEDAPGRSFVGNPKLTVRMAAILQGFPRDWSFSGKKTNAYRQVGNAFPPPVAKAVGLQIKAAIELCELHNKEDGEIYENEAFRIAR
ncbi:MAG TPA: DNA cytosine methyltransferase [Clostridia bacterium]|nr:DNA cytosine methyltransferase [Clostridia bacterium]